MDYRSYYEALLTKLHEEMRAARGVPPISSLEHSPIIEAIIVQDLQYIKCDVCKGSPGKSVHENNEVRSCLGCGGTGLMLTSPSRDRPNTQQAYNQQYKNAWERKWGDWSELRKEQWEESAKQYRTADVDWAALEELFRKQGMKK